jgi:hypothetical protein
MGRHANVVMARAREHLMECLCNQAAG